MVLLPHPNKQQRVLVIEGGGFRALGSLLVLQEIMNAVQNRAIQKVLPCEVYDLICGTSTGGLVAVLLGRLGLDCAAAIEIYKKLTVSICKQDEGIFWKNLLQSVDSGLDPTSFERELAAALKTYTGSPNAEMIPKGGKDILEHPSTNVFVTVTSEAPFYDNLTHSIRSYQSTRHTPPVGHQWAIQEAVRGTLSSSLFLPPLEIKPKYTFGDAGFAGFSSPLGLLANEVKELWPYAQIGPITCLGPGLSALAPKNPRREWAVTDAYAKRFSKQIMEKLKSTAGDQDDLAQNASNVVKMFVTLAVDTELSHSDFSGQGTLIRLDPPLDLELIDLVDYFHQARVENSVKKWLQSDEGKKKVNMIAESLVEPGKVTVETARLITPPTPPRTTNPGYNPKLDERRPETMIEYLRNYHVLFIIDDSGSMGGHGRWKEARDALSEIANHALNQKVNSIDIRFLNNRAIHRGFQGADFIEELFNRVQPGGLTPTGKVLHEVLNDHIDELDRAVNTIEYASIKPLDIIVLTDGVPDDEPNTKGVIEQAVHRRETSKHHPNAMGIQLVQIGNDPNAAPVLNDLRFGAVGSMVDTVPYDGKLTPQRLERILLGGLHPNIRAMIQT